MQLWIAEKPSVAKAICAELGIVKKGACFNECKGGNTVTWCFGHLLEHAGPDAYTPDDVPVTKKGKKICASSDGIELLKLVPELVRNPILTAVFERKLRDVESGKSTLGSFIESQQKFILQEINKAKAINNGLQ